MKTVTAQATATVELNEDIEIEVADDATEEQITQLLETEAKSVFEEIMQLANGLEPDIEIGNIEIDDYEEQED